MAEHVKSFIEQMLPYAVEVGDRYGIDPVTIITQAAIETGWGQEVAGNNYFGIKSHGRPGGQMVNTTEEVNGKKIATRDSFRVYPDMAQSVADYGEFLSSNPRYAQALQQNGYKDQLKGITGAGYATDSNYGTLVDQVSNMVSRNMRPLPPGSIPTVATALSTSPLPKVPPAPVTASPDMAMMRRAAAPAMLIPDTFGRLPKSSGNLGDSLAMSPIMGGNQQAPLFDAMYDARTGNMVRVAPMDSQGIAVGVTKAPAPVPASVEDRVTARNRSMPPMVRLPELPPSAIGQPPTTRTVASISMTPSPPAVSASDMTRGKSGISTVATIPTMRPALPQSFAGMDRAPPVPDRLSAGVPGMPSLYGGFQPQQVAQIGVPGPAQPRTMVASASPYPMPRPNWMPAVGTQLATTPMPPMPIARPQVTPPRMAAPMPMPANMRPRMAMTDAPLKITVNGGNTQPQQPATPQGFTDTGNGRLVSNETGGIYYARHLR